MLRPGEFWFQLAGLSRYGTSRGRWGSVMRNAMSSDIAQFSVDYQSYINTTVRIVINTAHKIH